jgi:hypothetical protein
MGCKCQTSIDYANCNQAAVQQLVDDATITRYAASAGAKSSDWTLCVVKSFLYARRLIYSKVSPGDCGTQSYGQLSSPGSFAAIGLGGAAQVDPEPISKGILSGLASITGIFGAHHAQAVITEEDTICKVSSYLNSSLASLENAVKAGNVSPDSASQILSQVGGQLDPLLGQIAKPCNAACGFRIGIRALVSFMTDIGFPLLAPSSLSDALFSQPVLASPGAPGTYGSAGSTTPLPQPTYQGASGPLPNPFNANNMGSGPSSLLSPGTLIVIGGIVYAAS